MSDAYSGPDRRRTSRLAIDIAATLRERGRTAFFVRLVDVSTLGCRLELWSDLEAGAMVWLKLPGLEPRYARIAWSCGGFAGVAFEEALHEAVVDALVAIDRTPTPAETEELSRISERCRAAAGRDSADADAVPELLALAEACTPAAP